MINLFKISINRLAFMFYEFHIRLLFLYNAKKYSSYSEMQYVGMSKLFGASSASIILGFNIGLLSYLFAQLFSLDIDFLNPISLFIFATISYIIGLLTIDKNNFFEKTFISKERKFSTQNRIKHHLFSVLIWFTLPILFLIGFICN